MTTCDLPDCEKKRAKNRRHCSMHVWRMKDHGSYEALRPKPPETLADVLSQETDECIIWPHTLNGSGYGIIYLDRPSKKATMVPRLVLTQRVGGPPSPKHLALHGPCHNPACVNYRHLRWGTQADNSADMLRDSTRLKGEDATPAKLTEAQAIEIKRRRAAGETTVALGREFGVNSSTISRLARGENWSFLGS